MAPSKLQLTGAASSALAGATVTSVAVVALAPSIDASDALDETAASDIRYDANHAIVFGDSSGVVHVALAVPADATRFAIVASVPMHRGSITKLVTTERRVAGEVSSAEDPVVAGIAASAPSAAGLRLYALLHAVTTQRRPRMWAQKIARKQQAKRERKAAAAGVPTGDLPSAIGAASPFADATRLPSTACVHYRGHVLPVTDVAVRSIGYLAAFTASLDSTVRVFDFASGAPMQVVSLGNNRPALSLAFDRTGHEPDIFFVGCVGAVLRVDMAPSSRPGVDVAASLSSAEPHPDVMAMQLTPSGASADEIARSGGWWFTRVLFDAAAASVQAATTETQLMWQPAIAFTEPSQRSGDAPEMRGASPPDSIQLSVVVDAAATWGMKGVGGRIVWPPEAIAERRSAVALDDAASDDSHEGAQPTGTGHAKAKKLPFADDPEVADLRHERDELRKMCADLMQRRKAARAEKMTAAAVNAMDEDEAARSDNEVA